jgi:hypothetical protein
MISDKVGTYGVGFQSQVKYCTRSAWCRFMTDSGRTGGSAGYCNAGVAGWAQRIEGDMVELGLWVAGGGHFVLCSRMLAKI